MKSSLKVVVQIAGNTPVVEFNNTADAAGYINEVAEKFGEEAKFIVLVDDEQVSWLNKNGDLILGERLELWRNRHGDLTVNPAFLEVARLVQ